MNRVLLSLLVCLVSGGAPADDGDETLRGYLAQSDVVVLGEFVSDPVGVSKEAGVVHYQADFRIDQTIQENTGGLMDRSGLIHRLRAPRITVNIVRLESHPDDRPPQLKEGGRCILFLRCNDRQPTPTYVTADVWFGIQPPSPTMAKALERLAGKSTDRTRLSEKPAEPPKGPVPSDLAGDWRALLPAGFEQPITLTRVDGNRYRLAPLNLTFGGIYERTGDRLVRVEPNEPNRAPFAWTIRSPYMLTLTEQPEGIGADYTGAVLFRPIQLPELQRGTAPDS